MNVRVTHTHAATAAPEDEYHEWVWSGHTCRRDSIGRRNGSNYSWLLMVCNNTECPAEAVLREDALGEMVEEVCGSHITRDECAAEGEQ